MKAVVTGPRTWILPLIHEEEEGREADTTQWWASDYILLVTTVQGADMVQLCFYQRDDDCEIEERDLDDLPLGIESRLFHEVDGETHGRVWSLDRIVGLPVDRLPGLTGALADAHGWALARERRAELVKLAEELEG